MIYELFCQLYFCIMDDQHETKSSPSNSSLILEMNNFSLDSPNSLNSSQMEGENQAPQNSPNPQDDGLKKRKQLFYNFSYFCFESMKFVSSKKQKEFKIAVKKFKQENLNEWMEEVDSYDLDQIFQEKTTQKSDDILIKLSNSLVSIIEENQNDLKTEIENLDSAREFISIYSISYSNKLKKLNHQSISIALEAASYIQKIKELCEKEIESIEEKLKGGIIKKDEAKLQIDSFKYQNFLKSCNVRWSYSYIRFLINLHELCEKYPKLKQTSLKLEFLKSNLKKIREKLEENPAGWTN